MMSPTESPVTLVLGASENPDRYSYLAVRRLRASGHAVVAIGQREGQVEDVRIKKEWEVNQPVDTITLYLNPRNQAAYQDRILALSPRRIVFNPGTENDDFQAIAREKGIEVVEGCTLVMLSTGMY